MMDDNEEWVVGIDSSTQSVAMVAIRVDSEAPQYHARKVKLHKGFKRPLEAFDIARRFGLVMPPASIAYCLIEAPVLAMGGKTNVATTIKQAIVNGAIQAGVLSVGTQFVDTIPSASWKAEALGDGSLKKPEVIHMVHHWYPDAIEHVGVDEDLNDAWAIAECAVIRYKHVRDG